MVAPHNTRTFNSQSGFSLKIEGTKKTTYLYLGDQVCLLCLCFSENFADYEDSVVGHELALGEPIYLATNGD